MVQLSSVLSIYLLNVTLKGDFLRTVGPVCTVGRPRCRAVSKLLGAVFSKLILGKRQRQRDVLAMF